MNIVVNVLHHDAQAPEMSNMNPGLVLLINLILVSFYAIHYFSTIFRRWAKLSSGSVFIISEEFIVHVKK